MSEASLKRALEIMTTLNEATVTVHMVRAMAQKALDDHQEQQRNTHKEAVESRKAPYSDIINQRMQTHPMRPPHVNPEGKR